MTGHYEYSFHRLAAFAYADVRSIGGRLRRAARAVRGVCRCPLAILAQHRAAVGRRTVTAVAAAVRNDDSR
ncbi:hypothetical protein DIE14_04950 [Burkholderia sp. Bp9017]|nr:hypothetical protein DIE14_04950 [Burkholderia sp. Bp9017]RQZ36336.1 hypothetical protein DIE13_07290 [Burkholderia sp. Bp9016]